MWSLVHECPEYPKEPTLQGKVDNAYWVDTRSTEKTDSDYNV